MAKQDFVVTVRLLGGPHVATARVITIDPRDIYQAEIAADLRALCREAIGDMEPL